MDPVLLARAQFALTTAFHYLFPPMSIGLGVCLVIMEGTYLATRNPLWQQVTKFWVRVFGLTFALGVASGIVLEFQFGTNWSAYSRFVGDVFGSALAAEGIFAFFLESGFLAILLFGWNKVGPVMHFVSTVMVCLGAHFSAVWILVANSWMQTPAGHHVVEEAGRFRAEITGFWDMVFNPSSMTRLGHTLMGCWQTGAFMVLSISAFYLLRKRHQAFALASVKVAAGVALAASLLSLASGHDSVEVVAEHQPPKFLAMEGHFAVAAPIDSVILGRVDLKRREARGLRIPGLGSRLLYGNAEVPVRGLDGYPPEDVPPVAPVFHSFRLMVLSGLTLILLALLTAWSLLRGRLADRRWLLWALVFAVPLPHLANLAGWVVAEVGRQPWIVYGLLRTADAISPNVSASHIAASLTMFVLVYLLLFALFVFLLDQKIRKGPLEADLLPSGSPAHGARAG